MPKIATDTIPEMYYDPFGDLLDRKTAARFDNEEMLLCDYPEDRVETFAVLAEGSWGDELEKRMKCLHVGERDVFAPGNHFLAKPVSPSTGAFSYSLAFFLSQKQANRLSDKKASSGDEIELDMGAFGNTAVPVGYATLHLHFQRMCDIVGGEEHRPEEYSLFLHPDAFFLDHRFRGHGLGRFMGAVLADSVKASLWQLDRLSKAFGTRTELDIDSYFEIYSKGGEDAVDLFNSEIEETKDHYVDAAKPGLVVRDFKMDGGW